MTANGPFLTLSQAARATGKSKSVLHSAIKSGKLSVYSRQGNVFQIDPAELYRVYPQNMPDTHNERSETPFKSSETPQNAPNRSTLPYPDDYIQLKIDVAVLRETLKLRDEKLDSQTDSLHDLRQERDHWRSQAETLLLSDQRAKPEESDAAEINDTAPRDTGWRATLTPWVVGITGLLILLLLLWAINRMILNGLSAM